MHFVQFMMSANSRIRFGLKIVFVYFYITLSNYHHCANLSEDVELIKFPSDTFVECVSKIMHIISVIHYTICGAVCFQFTYFPCDIEIIYIRCLIIIIKSEVWNITQCLRLGHETMVWAVCLSVFLLTSLIPAWISNYIHYKVWDEIIYIFLNFNGETVKVKEWIRNFIPHFSGHVILLIYSGIKVNPC